MLPNILQLFEGDGAPVQSNLYERIPEEGAGRFEKTIFIVASNKLPFWNRASTMNKLYETQWVPLMTRVEMVHLKESYVDSSTFPYDADMLASALAYLMEKKEDHEFVPE